jgi:hypothetical protein
MSKKPDLAASFRETLQAKRDEETIPSPAPLHTPPPPPEAVPVAKKRGPSGGKRTDKKTYCQTSIYIKIDTRKLVKRALEDDGTNQDVSELVQELLERWLDQRS